MTPPGLRDHQSARIVAATLTLLSREIKTAETPLTLWTPPLTADLIRDLAGRVADGTAWALWFNERHPALGLLIYSLSEWESHFLGYQTARLMGPFLVVEDPLERGERVRRLARTAVDLSQRRGHRLLAVKTGHDPAIINGFLAEGFRLAEIGAVLTGPIPGEPGPPLQIPPGFALLEEIEDPRETAEQMGDFFYDGHHRHNPHIGPPLARQLWTAIAAQDLASPVNPSLALWDRKRDRPAGLVSARLGSPEAGLSILAVQPAYWGRGFGRLLMRAIYDRLAGRARSLRVETAAYNLPALALYQEIGLKPATPLAALHYLPGPAPEREVQ